MASVEILQRLQCLLLHLSPGCSSKQEVSSNNKSITISNQAFQISLGFDEIFELSELLLAELRRMIERESDTTVEEVVLLLRCSFVLMRFSEFRLDFGMKICWDFMEILRSLRATLLSDACGKNCSSNVGTSSWCAMLEVVVDEFLVNPQFRNHFVIADCVSDSSEKMFVLRGYDSDYSAILELISCHYLLAICDEHAFKRFIGSLSWSSRPDVGFLGLSLDAALVLLGLPVISCLPHMLQAHIILLVARCVSIQMPINMKNTDIHTFNISISILESSVYFYTSYMGNLELEICGSHVVDDGQLRLSLNEAPLEAFVHLITREKVEVQTDKLIDYCSNLCNFQLFTSKANNFLSVSSYINENKHVLDEHCRDEASLVLNHILSKVTSRRLNNALYKAGEASEQELCCIAATIKLMGTAFLQMLCFLRQNVLLGTLKENALCREYVFLLDTIGCFEKYVAKHNIQEIFLDASDAILEGHISTKSMFTHFLSLFVYSFNRRLGFLERGCIFMMMVTINFLFLEEGNLDMFQPLYRSVTNSSCSNPSPPETSQNNQFFHSGSLIKYSNEDHCITSCKEIVSRGLGIDHKEDCDSSAIATVTINGLAYLKCLPDYNPSSSEWADLADFIECKGGKDYPNWLKQRTKFSGWKNAKREVVKHQKRKKRRNGKIFNNSST